MHLLARSLSFLLLFLTIQTGKTQSAPVHYTGTSVKIEGQLVGYHPDSFPDLMVKLAVVNPGPELQTDYEVWPDAQGNFSFELENGFIYQQIWMTVGDYYFAELMIDEFIRVAIDLPALAAKDGDSFDAEEVSFSGKSGEMTAYLNKYVDYRNSHPDNPRRQLGPILMDRKMSAAKKVEGLRKMNAQTAQIEAAFIAENPSPYAWILENERLSDHYGFLCTPHYGKKMSDDLLQEIKNHRPKVISNGSMSYYRYLGIYLRSNTQAEKKAILADVLPNQGLVAEEKEDLVVFLDEYEKRIKEETYDEEAFKKYSTYFQEQYGDAIFAAVLDQYKQELSALSLSAEEKAMVLLCTTPEDIWQMPIYQKTVRPLIKAKWAIGMAEVEWDKARKAREATQAKLSKIKIEEQPAFDLGQSLGNLSDGAMLFQADQDSLEVLLSAIRAAHPGKAIVLDVWATWCGPCILDMRHERTIPNRDKLKEMDVEVVYLCSASSSDQDTWKKKVAELGVGGQHIFLTDQLSKEIMNYFDLRGFPSHVFLNKEGRVVPDVLHSIRDVDFYKVKKSLD
ncbi:MAG TPA: redoxin family protein [Saprospiraceae bacterium]|nr:redoxin family protein [Saprospiraceae bacterium]